MHAANWMALSTEMWTRSHTHTHTTFSNQMSNLFHAIFIITSIIFRYIFSTNYAYNRCNRHNVHSLDHTLHWKTVWKKMTRRREKKTRSKITSQMTASNRNVTALNYRLNFCTIFFFIGNIRFALLAFLSRVLATWRFFPLLLKASKRTSAVKIKRYLISEVIWKFTFTKLKFNFNISYIIVE